jgi:hypothetical protein
MRWKPLLLERGEQRLEVGGLDEVMVEAGGARAVCH